MKILMIVNMAWKRELGAARTSIELAEELQRLGHTVDKFDLHDALPPLNKLLAPFKPHLFSFQALRHVRKHGHRYDVIQAEEGTLPGSKKKLKFSGVLVSRTNGARHLYHQHLQKYLSQHREILPKTSRIGNIVRWLAGVSRNNLRAIESSFRHADLVVVNNRDEMEWISDNLGCGEKLWMVPNGLSAARRADFEAQNTPPTERLRSQQVVFIGSWHLRKGRYDLPVLVRQVRTRTPSARFLFVGGGAAETAVLGAFDAQDQASIEVVPYFDSARLPTLLTSSTVSILPSYIEGFPLCILESLAAGIPTLAYDVPGSREMLDLVDYEALIAPGDVTVFSRKISEILESSDAEYERLSRSSAGAAARFRQEEIAIQMVEIYRKPQHETGKSSANGSFA